MILSSLWLEIDAGVSNLSSVEFTGKPPSRFKAAARDRLWTCLTAALGHSVTFNRPHCIDCPFLGSPVLVLATIIRGAQTEL